LQGRVLWRVCDGSAHNASDGEQGQDFILLGMFRGLVSTALKSRHYFFCKKFAIGQYFRLFMAYLHGRWVNREVLTTGNVFGVCQEQFPLWRRKNAYFNSKSR
jgi:hypothetical protein